MKDRYFEDDDFSLIRSIIGLLTFSTIIPINVHTSLRNMTRMVWVWPLIHLIIGVLAAICGWICLDIFHLNTLFAGVMVYVFLMIITGYNHIDGLMDMSDGVMVHGDHNKKLIIMKDSFVGAAGVTSAVLVALLTIAGLCNLLEYNFIKGIVIAEMVSKSALLTTALTSKPTKGIGEYFIRSTNWINYLLSTVIVAIVAYLIGGFIGIAGLIGAIIGGFVVSKISARNFKVATGDVLGASNEIGRVIALLFMSVALFYL